MGKENLSIPDSLHETDEDIIAAFIKNFYGANPSSVPKEIILPILPQESLLLTAWLSKLRNGDVKIYVPERGFKRRLKDMAQSNAAKYLADKKLQWEYQDAREQGAVNKLKELLHLPKLPERIECFDISHNQVPKLQDPWLYLKADAPIKGIPQIQTAVDSGDAR